MKITATVLIFVSSVLSATAQRIDTSATRSPSELRDYHLQKRNANRTAAWILLGAGTLISTIAIASNLEQGLSYYGPIPPGTDPNKGKVAGIVGFVSSLASIPFFIMAGHHKRKARLALTGGIAQSFRGYQYGATLVFKL